MILQWHISNFKSVREDTRLQLAPLTILAGANSSGKSSVIQSLLLLSQSLTSQVGQRALLLNGPLVTLGNFDDIRSVKGKSTITIGCSLLGDVSDAAFFSPANRVEASCEVEFGTRKAVEGSPSEQLNPQPVSVSLRARMSGAEVSESAILIRRVESLDRAKLDQIASAQNPFGDQDGFNYDVNLDVESRAATLGPLQHNTILGCYTQHFVPQGIFVYVNVIDYYTSLYSDLRVPFLSYGPASLEPIDHRLVQTLRDQLTTDERTALHFDDPLGGLASASSIYLWRLALQRALSSKGPTAEAALEQLKTIVTTYFARWPFSYQIKYQPLQGPLASAGSYLLSKLPPAIKYLGPLRHEPRPLEPLATTAEQKNVGLRGEQSAAVFNLFKDELIAYISSEAFLAVGNEPLAATTTTLGAAVLDWLRYMGLVETVQVTDLGKLGHELRFTTEGVPTLHDITHVGVGVSQVFPIVLMALLSNRDETLILEQPELHLHPKVQSQLADFFLSVALNGRQCIIETHSEYLINRLRYRAALEQNRITLDNTKIYFVEKRNGSSHFREVSINEFGAIGDWPEGFFDQSQLEAENILRAAISKRRGLSKASDD
jgi:predicted ATPase